MRKPRHKAKSFLISRGGDCVHIRLCHFCLHLNESLSPIMTCSHCGKSLSRFVEGIDIDSAELWETIELDEELMEGTEQPETTVPKGSFDLFHINGLAVRW